MNIKFKYKLFRIISLFLAINLVGEIIFPTVAYALTSGPSQPEVQTFAPVGTTEMVDLFSGDFSYNIPLFELPGPNGGYPFSLGYNSGITMDQEASWVGLGWNLNPGAINRQMRGIPDEFNGNPITHEMSIKPNVTFGAGVGVDLEVFGAELSKLANLTLGIGVYYNNYKGVGYNIEPSLGFHTAQKSGLGAGAGFGISLDSQEGVGANASLSLSDKGKNSKANFELGIGYNSKSGLTNLSMGFTASNTDNRKDKTGKEMTDDGKYAKASFGGSSRLSFSGNSYSPSIGMPMQGRNVSLSFKMGGAIFGVFGDGSINGFFSTQYLKNKITSAPAYGYLNLQNAVGDNSLMDFNREKDGPLRKNSPNLASPSLTYDIYSVAGHGVGGMYRPCRNDIGILSDARVESNSVGGSGGVDIGPGSAPHIGVAVHVNYSESVAGRWTDNNDVLNDVNNNYRFTNTDGTLYEPYYFKSHGEHTSDSSAQLAYINDESPVRFELQNTSAVGVDTKFKALNNFAGSSAKISNKNPAAKEREPRNFAINPIKNDNTYSCGLYVINEEGVRYNYGKPAMNKTHIDAQFSIDAGHTDCENIINIGSVGSTSKPDICTAQASGDQYFSRTTMNNFAHSFLLTEILGADYVDADNSGGASDGDFGYWVKFNYTRTSTDYQWRVPFAGANYLRGLNTTPLDDKGAYMYGTKEMWYLSSAETKTHIAVFNTSTREDGRGAYYQLQDPTSPTTVGDYSYKLNSVKLFTKNEYYTSPGNINVNAKPMQTVNFAYSYALCPNVPNNKNAITTDRGKLTLKQVSFTYENNSRGSLSPYIFDYHETVTAENPSYDTHKYDRWGNYKNSSTATQAQICANQQLPYVDQFRSDDATKKGELDINMAVWNLKEITLPSGGKIKVDYESDDYAYVQNKTAMQMVKVASLKPANISTGQDHITHPRYTDGSNRRIYFDLEYPISNLLTAQQQKDEVGKYMDETRKLYFRAYMKIRKNSDALDEYVSGYADVADWNVDLTSVSGAFYTRGYIEVEHLDGFHPFSVAAWQHIRTNAPDLMGLGNYDADPNSNKSTQVNKIKSLCSVIPTMVRTFIGYRTQALLANWGEYISDLNKTVIRLNTPDKCKFGGGVRVKQITLSDQWDVATGGAETPSNYGQVYDYTILESGQTISSGVASYEPMIGGDEIALRSVKEYPEKIPLKTDNNLFFELPVNEGYYPGASVGYRKVTVKSLATFYAATSVDDVTGGLNIPAGIMTTGATVHEFYTAKEFPVITAETDIDRRPFDLFIPIPLIGQITVNNITASQGYSIQLNDMHGKPKKISNYRQDKNGVIVSDPISWIKYNYKADTRKKDGYVEHDYYTLNNLVPVILGDNRGIVSRSTRLVGQEYEFFTDMRQMRIFSSTGGASINTDIIIIPPVIVIPAFVPWPNIGSSTTEVRTAVTNKIIHKSGILISTEAYNEGSLIKTENKFFDGQTGEPILTTVTNDFDDPIFNYKIPAHYVYNGMGPSYKNIGYTFSASITATTNPNISTIVSTTALDNILVPGDEFLIGSQKVVFIDKKGTNLYFGSKTTFPGGSPSFTLIRSGRRNMLSATAGTVTTLGSKTDPNFGDPTLQSNRTQ